MSHPDKAVAHLFYGAGICPFKYICPEPRAIGNSRDLNYE